MGKCTRLRARRPSRRRHGQASTLAHATRIRPRPAGWYRRPARGSEATTMSDKQKKKQVRIDRRKYAIRKIVSGTSERPRLTVFRSDKHIYAQIIDDIAGKTLAAAASTEKDLRGEMPNGGNVKAAILVGNAVAER